MIKEIFVSEAACLSVKEELRRRAAILTEIAASELTYPAVASHADMYCCSLGKTIVRGRPEGAAYPQNIGMNGVRLGGYFIHNLKYTSQTLMSEVRSLNLTPVHVKQGYTKCNLVVVEDGITGRHPSVITSDRGIAAALSALPVDLLLVAPGHVALPGLPYGFLGGASGNLGREILFHGDLTAHPDFTLICAFIRAHGKEPIWYPDFPLTDIGSIITLM